MTATHGPQSIELGGKELDMQAFCYGFKRRRYLWVFKESDRSLREKMVKYFKGVEDAKFKKGS